MNPALRGLAEDGVDFSKLAPEQIVMQWMNHHLKKAKCPRKANNFTSDIQDSEIYAILMGQIAKGSNRTCACACAY
jgi:hypothetical protein